jgi:hypothetical protein
VATTTLAIATNTMRQPTASPIHAKVFIALSA